MVDTKVRHFWNLSLVSRFYYLIKPVIPRALQVWMRRFVIRRAVPRFSSTWPINKKAAYPPTGWPGWPDDKQFALILTHDVESARGVDRCRQLAQLEMELGFRSSFNFLIKKYSTPDELRQYLNKNGFEVGIHGCYHDGKKYNSRKIFLERAFIINQHLRNWSASGFRSPSMQCNLDWIGDLDIEYDLSTFDTDPFEPQTSSVSTIFPFLISRIRDRSTFVEMPYTLPQDFTLFILLGEKTTDIWKRKLDWVAEKGGMVLMNVHPDYMVFSQSRPRIDEYSGKLYKDLLLYLNERYENQFYHALPRELARYCLYYQDEARDKYKEDTRS